jgi:hypothetical protein
LLALDEVLDADELDVITAEIEDDMEADEDEDDEEEMEGRSEDSDDEEDPNTSTKLVLALCLLLSQFLQNTNGRLDPIVSLRVSHVVQ